MKVIVGGVIEKDGKYLLVQEAQEKCYQKWNVPAGHLDFNESIEQGSVKEIKEETGCDVELNGILYIANRILEDDIFVMIIFSTKLINENIQYDKNEVLDVQWFSYDEIMNEMDDKLRTISNIKTSISNHKNNLIGSIDLLNILNN